MERIRLAMEDLGPVFVKLSTRRDLLPDDIVEELVNLQIVYLLSAASRPVHHHPRNLKRPISEVFDDFAPQPLACIGRPSAPCDLNPGRSGYQGNSPSINVPSPKILPLVHLGCGMEKVLGRWAQIIRRRST